MRGHSDADEEDVEVTKKFLSGKKSRKIKEKNVEKPLTTGHAANFISPAELEDISSEDEHEKKEKRRRYRKRRRINDGLKTLLSKSLRATQHAIMENRMSEMHNASQLAQVNFINSNTLAQMVYASGVERREQLHNSFGRG